MVLLLYKRYMGSRRGEASSFGAAYVAMAAVGAVSNLRQQLPAMEVSRIIQPDSKNVEIYQKSYKKFKKIYEKMYGEQN